MSNHPNPLLQGTFGTPYESVPFDQIEPQHYIEALQHWSAIVAERREAIATTPEESFETVIEPLESITHEISRIYTVFGNVRSAEDTEELRILAPEISRLMTELGHSISLDERLFQKVTQVYQQEYSQLEGEAKELLRHMYTDFIRAGAQLTGDDRRRFQDIEIRLGELSLEFGNHVLAEQNAYEYLLTKEKLQGLPQDWIDRAAESARGRGYDDGWVVTLDAPSVGPFLTYSAERKSREDVMTAYSRIGNNPNEYNNRTIIEEIASLRAERAHLLGYRSHAEYVLEDRMAERIEHVQELSGRLYQVAYPKAKEDMEEVRQYAQEHDGLHELMGWDYAYYAEKLKQARFSLDDEQLKPYFPLNQVIQSLFGVANRLYGLTFEKTSEVSVYHPDVEVFVVNEESGDYCGLLYLDLYARLGKRSGAWMTEFRSQWIERDFTGEMVNQRPHISFVMNLAYPSSEHDTLLTLREVETAFHEFGHGLHGLLSNVKYESLSGTNVLWDFVELPSQLMENWVSHPEFIQTYVRHYQTQEPLPEELRDTLARLRSFQEGYFTLRQLRFSHLDLDWHSRSTTDQFDTHTIEQSIRDQYDLFPPLMGSAISTQFSHIFQGGYSAGYYSYKWAEVLDADVFEKFSQEGIFSRALGTRFREMILSKGGSQHPAQLYRAFMGRDPQVEPLLKRAGLLE